ncbi:putative ABC transport system permease protein [Paenibacillus xylanexedens]|uniref:ABC transporter permease n=1 Tax=Paenibacillus xylanexedens TaxID=528191 RepID=UPI00209DB6B9|nr:ABC transporter permease [Paenibacillus xylanexedens]MCP1421590.1 putative ABC transport system permease protein [Paenibacillus xylanexedens]
MSFPQFAFNNIRRNGRAYIAFFLSSVFMVMIFFAYAVFIYHPYVADLPMGDTTATGMQIASVIVYVFAFFFVMYSISAFLKSRNKEFGILTILGAEPRQIRRLVILENMLIGSLSIIAGIGGGMLLSKLFLMLTTRFIGMDDLPFYFPVKAILITIGAFLLLFFCISLFTLIFIGNKRTLELLTGTNKPKKEPKASWFFSLLGFALLTVGFVVLRNGLNGGTIMLAAITGIAGTYFFYSQLSVLIIRLLKRNRKTVWHGTRLLWISEMSYKMKDNARMLFMVTVVIAIASMSAVVILSLDQENREQFTNNDFAIQYNVFRPTEQLDMSAIDSKLEAAGLDYQQIYLEYLWSSADQSAVSVMPLSQYNQYNLTQGRKMFQLDTGSALFVDTRNEKGQDQIKRNRFRNYAKGDKLTLNLNDSPLEARVTDTDIDPQFGTLLYATGVVVLPDEKYEEIAQQIKDNMISGKYLYQIPAWGHAVPDRHSSEAMVSDQLLSSADSIRSSNASTDNQSGYLTTRYGDFERFRQGTALFTFLGIFIGLIFSISSASFLYFRLHTDLEADGRMVHSLSKMGLSFQEMKRSSTVQIAILFFLPIGVAIIETLVVVKPFLTEFGITNYTMPVLTVFGAFVLAQTFYFIIIRSRYIASLRKMMV